MSYFQATYSTLVTRDGYVLSVPNGTSVAGLGLTASLTGGTGSQGVLGLQEVYPAIPGLVMSEWQEGNLVSLPIDLTPTSGTLVNDTMYTLRFASLISTQSTQIVDYMLILMVGDPYDADLTVTPTQNSQPVTAPIDVTVGSSIIALGLSVAAQNASGQGIGLATTVSNTGTTGIDPSQFSGFGSAGLTAPNGTASGVFDTEGTLTVRMYGWGINQYASGSAWAYEYYATVVEFDINVLPDPRIGMQDAAGTITTGATASGDRDFGTHDIGTLPTGWSTFTVTNTGVGNLALSDPTLTTPFAGAGAAAFDLDLSGYSHSVPAGSSTWFAVRMGAGATVGANAAWVSITHNDPTLSGDFTFEITGDVTSTPVIEVSDSGGPFAGGAAASGDRDFGQVDMAIMPVSVSFQVANTGSGSLLISGITLAGTNPGDFVLDTTGMIMTIAAGVSTSFDVQFDAATIGVKNAKVVIQHNAGADFEINLAGVATTTNIPVITVSSVPGGREGDSYSYALPATGGVSPYSFQLVSGALPAGLSLSSNGTISGTPSEFGTFQFTAEVKDSVGASSTQAISMDVSIGAGGGSGDGGGAGCTAQQGASMLAPLLLCLLLVYSRRRRGSHR
ncbi:MAG: choice-of-anchor D domain-containing protein [Planctomycetes bacterium]|nr:choice-of-anchor D domain-containing protein [Planctomycetota bacterium]